MLRPGPARFPKVAPHSVWLPSRQVPAATSVHLLKNGKVVESERFIFYRGLGRFNGKIRTRNLKDEAIEIHNPTAQRVPQAFILRVTNKGAAFQKVGPIPARSKRKVKIPGTLLPMKNYLQKVSTAFVDAIVKTGLYKDEAWAMANTWKTSYFQKPGLRILYVVPSLWTDQLLPIRISPKPTSLVRTLVGRIEVLTHVEEHDIVRFVHKAYKLRGKVSLKPYRTRFWEPLLWRGLALTRDRQVRRFIMWNLLRKAMAMP